MSSIGSTRVQSRLGSVGKKIRLPASRNPGSNPRHDRVRCLMSLACRLRSERPGFDSRFGSTAFRGIGRCRLRATETQQATPRNYADGRDRRRREAAATAPRAWSRKCPGEPTLKCGDKGYFSQQTVSRSAITRVIYQSGLVAMRHRVWDRGECDP